MPIWICVRAEFATPLLDWSPIHEVFAAAGCKGTIEHDDTPGLTGYLPGFTPDSEVHELRARLMASGALSVSCEKVSEADWENVWRSFFVTRPIGESLLIIPAWEEPSSDSRKVMIFLEPGQAFGTGEHATTRLCLEAVERLVNQGDSVLDIGTGSGILAIAAAKLGARIVHATECDLAAAAVAEENFSRNGVSVQLIVTSEVPKESTYSLVVSNLFSAQLVQIAPGVARALQPGGAWIVSGVIPDNLKDVETAAERQNLRRAGHRESEGWICVVFRKP